MTRRPPRNAISQQAADQAVTTPVPGASPPDNAVGQQPVIRTTPSNATESEVVLALVYVEAWLDTVGYHGAARYLRDHGEEIAAQMVEDECADEDEVGTTRPLTDADERALADRHIAETGMGTWTAPSTDTLPRHQ